ncbi:glycerophosphoryl diester phosphodiesterase [Marininema mesophilum]|uniref:Glycerophosphoryl diester phosphodiesterase n=1 Tax=Marininema mesophilum TaxID=1048340 RepID=A0A1H2YCX2_9BACL|nr:glycerophosphoryl diester phosphodiesterase [Marininema mesophilum]
MTAICTTLTIGLSPAHAEGKKVINIAHRGASGHAPEHTMPSYELGKKMGADYTEIDIQMTKDGKLINMHDETLDRTTEGTGAVKDHTLAEIKKLDAGSWFNKEYPKLANPKFVGLKVPTLDEVLTHFGNKTKYYIETKSPEVYPGMEEKLLKTLKAHGLLTPEALKKKQVIIQSFSAASLKKIHKINPQIPLIQLLWYEEKGLGKITEKEMDEIDNYAYGVGPNIEKINRDYVQKVRKHGLDIHPYTINDKKQMKQAIEWGVTGMFTNYADRLTKILHGK